MEAIMQWKYRNVYTPQSLLQQPGMIVKNDKLRCPILNDNFKDLVNNPLVFVTGDGHTLPSEVKAFEKWKLPHDVYCVNRSLLFFERPVDHWAAIDVEEAVWFSENLRENMIGTHPIWRHTIGEGAYMYDVWWERVFAFENDYQRRVWIGNTGYFAVLTAVEMGYSKIVLAGMPLDTERHWYQPEGTPGPQWNPLCQEQWTDYRTTFNGDCNIRSMGAKTAEIFGLATKEWAEDVGTVRKTK